MIGIGTLLATAGMTAASKLISNLTDVGVKGVTQFVEDKTGIKIDDEKQVKELSPEQQAEVTARTMEYINSCNDHELKMFDAHTKNTSDAREMAVDMANVKEPSWAQKNFIFAYASVSKVINTFIMFAPLVFMYFYPDDIDSQIAYILGIITMYGINDQSTMTNFFFGSRYSPSKNQQGTMPMPKDKKFNFKDSLQSLIKKNK